MTEITPPDPLVERMTRPLVLPSDEYEAVQTVAGMLGMDKPAPALGERSAAATVTFEAVREAARKARYGEHVDTYTWDCVADAILAAVADLFEEPT
jgi:hypothetical protein